MLLLTCASLVSTDDVIHLSVATGDDVVSSVFVRLSSCVFLNSTIQAGGSSLLLLLPGDVTADDDDVREVTSVVEEVAADALEDAFADV